MLAQDVALGSAYLPFAAWRRLDPGRSATAKDAHAERTRAGRHGEGGAGGIDMAVVGRVEGAENPVEAVEGMEFANPRRLHQLHAEPEGAADRERVPQPVRFVFGIGEPERPAAVPGDCLACLGFQLPGVEADVVVHALAERETRRGVGDLPGRVPGGAGGQLGLLQEDDLRPPSLFREMPGQAHAHDSAADDHGARVAGKRPFLHRRSLRTCRPPQGRSVPLDTTSTHLYHVRS